MASTRAGFELVSMTNPQDSEAYRFEYDQETNQASMAVVAAVSEAMDVDPIELEPLHASVDPDALDALVHVRGAMNGDVHVTFTYEGRAITVYSYGVIAVTPTEQERTDGQSTGITQTADETSIPSEAALNAELKAVLTRAYENGITVEGGWECRNGPEHPDWDVVITEMSKKGDPE